MYIYTNTLPILRLSHYDNTRKRLNFPAYSLIVTIFYKNPTSIMEGEIIIKITQKYTYKYMTNWQMLKAEVSKRK
jgi:hypothetical protein